jgi:hypothetical protein
VAYNSINAGVSLLLFGVMLAQMVLVLPLPTWLGSVIATFVVACLLGWMGRPSTPAGEQAIRFELAAAPCCRPRDVGLCRRHRRELAEWRVRCGLEPADSVSPWFQLW